MKKWIVSFLTGILFFAPSFLAGQNKMIIFDEILFYDGYNNLDTLADEIVDVPDTVIRLTTSLITMKLTEGQLNMMDGTIIMDVVLKAACDNYNRLGHVNLALVPKDSSSYSYSTEGVKHIELGRFITPFMNKNIQPDTVPYQFDISNLKHVFQDQDLREQYNFWMELEVFGDPSAADTGISGCSGRNDVFYGTLSFTTSSTATGLETGNGFAPLFFKQNLNNYEEGATDEIGKTVKTISFSIDENLTDAQFVLITSNHGSNAGGEEYNRRTHYIYLNGEVIESYLPGRISCEPFRDYNTQDNEIYGSSSKTDSAWQSFSNWCPGDVIDTRIIDLDTLTPGTYTFKIDVPDAEFVNGEGNFPLSLYIQGKTNGTITIVDNPGTDGKDTTFVVFDKILFYDGYNTLEKLANEIVPVPEGVFRLKTSVVTTKLSEEQLDLLDGDIIMDVVIKAACDNYDRLGHVNLALVPKDSSLYSYSTEGVEHIELARFITPFMNKNLKPDTVPYQFNVSNMKHIFQDRNLREKYNFWMELDVFGVPYAANTEVSGCSGRSDVFYGTLSFTTSSIATELETDNGFAPLFFKNTFNNFQEGATDEIGKTVKSISFVIEEELTDAQFVLITSNHGANSGGEEYNRRWHYVYLNGKQILMYLPGRTSCEPFRVYNTQGNGIYGASPRTNAVWQSFSNWCPGDVIDTRIIDLGTLTPDTHTFKIEVPTAKFVDRQGNIPLSLYLQGKTNGKITVIDNPVNNYYFDKEETGITVFPNPFQTHLILRFDNPGSENAIISLYNTMGQCILTENRTINDNQVILNTNKLSDGIYYLKIILGKEVHTIKVVAQ